MRFTKSKYEEIHKNGGAYDTFLTECYNKLERLEDVEEYVGLDLCIVFDALRQGYIYVKDEELNPKIWWCSNYQLGSNGDNFYFYCQYGCMDTTYDFFNIKDYGKTWALTEEELSQ